MIKRKRFFFISIFFFLVFSLFAAPFELVNGDLKLVLYPELGGFSLMHLSDIGKNRYLSLFDDRDSSGTSWFSVISNGRIFKLAKKAGKPIVFENNSNSARYTYTLTDDFQVVQNFSFMIDESSGSALGLRIDTMVENTSGAEASFAIKALIDTSLGESEGIHFSTNLVNRISSEMCLSADTDTDSVIVSKNKNASLEFLLGGIATKPNNVCIANWDRLNTLTWEPEIIVGRSFNTVYTVNDSALLFIWPQKNLAANDILTVTMVLGPQSEALSRYAKLSGQVDAAEPKKNVFIPTDITQLDTKEKNLLLQQVLGRIAEIRANPNSASDAELEKLSAQLDLLMKQIKE